MAERSLAVVPQATVVAEHEWSEARKQFVLSNYCNDAPPAIAMVFIEEAMRRGLSPEAKQIYLIPRTSNGSQKWMSQTSIDGYRLLADRTRRYAGSDDATFEFKADGKTLERATVTVWKMVEGQRCPFTATAYWDEYNANQNLWKTKPRVMLAKCAEALALRKAFPAELSGLYTDAEMDQADVIDAPSVRVTERRPTPTAPIAPNGEKKVDTLGEAKATLWREAQAKGLTLELLEDYAQLEAGAGLGELTTAAVVKLTQQLKRADRDALLDRLTNQPGDGDYVDVEMFDTTSPDRFTR